MPAKIYRAAQTRLLEIWNYTERIWGEKQADAYIRELVDAANLAGDERHRWRPLRERTLPGVFFVRHRHHYIFFRELSGGTLGVISILHENMDIPARLREDARSG
ncbi:plasmid stabilization protein [Opitutaceae bacterium TAV5]|nr:plasmid stabilization protein [Opitutaceae bacterium TAV5]